MNNKNITASKLREKTLIAFKKGWDNYPAKDGYVVLEELWKPIWNKYKDFKEPLFGSSVINSLIQDKFIDTTVVPDNQGKEHVVARITDEGLSFLSNIRESRLTRRIALVGAITGTIGLIVAICTLLMRLFAG